MSFVYENINSTRALELTKIINSKALGLSNALQKPILSPLLTQTIDRERDIVFLSLGGKGWVSPERGEPPTGYALLWKGAMIFFEGYDKGIGTPEIQYVNINIKLLLIPETLKDHEQEILHAIQEAMACYWSGRWERHVTITVHFLSIKYS